VLVARGIMSPREMEMPARTLLNWYRCADYTVYACNTRPMARSPWQKPAVYYLSSARRQAGRGGETTVTRYKRWRRPNETRPACRWDIADPEKPDPGLWDRVFFRATSFLFLLLHCIQITATHDAFPI
jgi:hypothetical protein